MSAAVPELAWLPVERCYVDPGYQRALDTPRGRKLVATIAAEFSWAKFGALMATPGEPDAAGPRWLIIDGQHRQAGARRRGVAHVPAVVHKNLSRAEQAAAFVGANRDRVQVYAQQIHRAQLLAGETEAITLERLSAAAGIRLLHYPLAAKQTPAGSTAAVPALLRILRRYGEALAGAAIAALGERFRRQPGGLRGPYFLAAALYLHAGGTPAALRAALARLDVRRLEDLTARVGANSAAAAIAAALARAMPLGTGARFDDERSRQQIVAAAAAQKRARPAGAAPRGRSPVKPPDIAAAPAAQASANTKRAAEEAAIARHLAAHGGARIVLGPEQAAKLLREAGHQAQVIERPSGKRISSASARGSICFEYWLDGGTVSGAAFYAAVNKVRAARGLPPAELPPSAAAAGKGTRAALARLQRQPGQRRAFDLPPPAAAEEATGLPASHAAAAASMSGQQRGERNRNV